MITKVFLVIIAEEGTSMTLSREKAWATSGSRAELWCRALRMGLALRKSGVLRTALRDFQAEPDELAGMDPATQAGVLSLLEEGIRQRLLAAEADCRLVDFARHVLAQHESAECRDRDVAAASFGSLSRPSAMARRAKAKAQRVLDELRWILTGVSPRVLRVLAVNESRREPKGSG
jgi:hypothetical protein